MWKEKPVTMIKKVAIVQGFRMAFPDEFGGMPYTAEELPDEMTKPAEPKPQTKSQGDFKKASEFISSADPDGIIKAKKGLKEYSWALEELEELESLISVREDELTQEVA